MSHDLAPPLAIAAIPISSLASIMSSALVLMATFLRGLFMTLGFMLIGLLGVVLAAALYRLHIHPLARVPGPRLAAVSNIWQAWQVRNGNMLHLAKNLHQRYGPVVRVGPNELWFDSKDAFKAIYGMGNGFEKSNFYLATLLQPPAVAWDLSLTQPDTLDLLSERDTKRYRRQRRTIGPTYSLASLQKHEPALEAAVERVVAHTALLARTGQVIDLKEWMHASVVECLGAAVLAGWSPGYLGLKSDCGSSAHALAAWRRKSVFGLFPTVTVLGMANRSLARWWAEIWGVTHTTPKGFSTFFPAVQKRITKRINAALAAKPGGAEPNGKWGRDLLDELIEMHKAKPDAFPETYLRRMAMTNFGAGHETMTSALVSAFAMVGTHPAVQERIALEICTTGADAGRRGMSYDAITASLGYTVAAVKEAQRLYPVIGMSVSRTVPASPPLCLHGHTVPPGTTVGCVPVALHRNAHIFGDDADTYRPERWLEASEERRRTMERVNLTYGAGARSCPGKELAKLVVYKLAVRLLGRFEVAVEGGRLKEEEVRYYFMAMLTGVKVRFAERGAGDGL